MHDVAGSRLDPAFDAHTLPIQFYALAWWETWLEPDQLKQHFTTAWYKLAAAEWRWNQVTGPVTAVLATVHRLKWRFTSAQHLITDQNKALDLLRDSPAYIVKQIHASVRRWQLARVINQIPSLIQNASVTSYGGDKISSKLLPRDVVYDGKALASLLGYRRGVPKDLKGMWCRDTRPWLHSTAIGAQWPQARVASVPGWSDDSSCQLCGHVPGNLAHRAVCPGNTPCGGWQQPSKAAQAGLDRLNGQQKDILFGTGLMVLQLPIPSPPQHEDFQWLLPPAEGIAPESLRWYIDGSLIDPQTPFERVGAGIVGLARGIPIAIATATPPEWVDTIPGAEAWSLYVVLAMCCSLPGVVTDCLGNRRTLLAGRADATAAARPLARVWNSIFNCCEETLLQELDSMLTWGPAHTSWASLGSRLRSDGLPLTAIDWRANGIADAAAKMAARRHRAPAHIRRMYEEAVAAHRYGAAVAGTACWEANHHQTTVIDSEGNVKQVVVRDSIGRQAQHVHSIADVDGTCKAAPAAGPDGDCGIAMALNAALPSDFPLQPGAMPLNQAALLADCWPDMDVSHQHTGKTAKANHRSGQQQQRQQLPKQRRHTHVVHDLGKQQPHHVVRSAAVQAAAFANAIADRATLRTADWLRPSEDNARNREIAKQLASSIVEEGRVDAVAPATRDTASTPTACDDPLTHDSTHVHDRRAFLEQLKSAAAMPSTATTSLKPAAKACTQSSSSRSGSTALSSRPAAQPPSVLRGNEWRNGISNAMRRLMG